MKDTLLELLLIILSFTMSICQKSFVKTLPWRIRTAMLSIHTVPQTQRIFVFAYVNFSKKRVTTLTKNNSPSYYYEYIRKLCIRSMNIITSNYYELHEEDSRIIFQKRKKKSVIQTYVQLYVTVKYMCVCSIYMSI